jgi:hypothetical protein
MFYWFCYSGSTFKCPDRGVAVGIGLAIALQSLLSGSGGFLLLKFSCFDLISLWDLSGFIRIGPIVESSQNTKNTQTPTVKIPLVRCFDRPRIELSYGNPGERKRLQCNSSSIIASPIPTGTGRNPAIQAFESLSATSKNQNHFSSSSLKTAHRKVWLDFNGSCSFSRDVRITPLSFMAKPARTSTAYIGF